MNAARRRLSLLCVLLLCAASPAPAQQVQLAFLDVGQGDAVLLLTPERKTMLVDAGPSGAAVLRYLRALGIDTLDLLVASHNHDDHIGGFPDLLAEIPIRSYMDNGVPTARTYRLYDGRHLGGSPQRVRPPLAGRNRGLVRRRGIRVPYGPERHHRDPRRLDRARRGRGAALSRGSRGQRGQRVRR